LYYNNKNIYNIHDNKSNSERIKYILYIYITRGNSIAYNIYNVRMRVCCSVCAIRFFLRQNNGVDTVFYLSNFRYSGEFTMTCSRRIRNTRADTRSDVRRVIRIVYINRARIRSFYDRGRRYERRIYIYYIIYLCRWLRERNGCKDREMCGGVRWEKNLLPSHVAAGWRKSDENRRLIIITMGQYTRHEGVSYIYIYILSLCIIVRNAPEQMYIHISI